MDSDSKLEQSYAELKRMLSKMQTQQETMAKQLKELAALPIVQSSGEYQQLKSLATCLPLFEYSQPSETFDVWYFKHREIFKKDTAPLSDRARVQLLLSRLGEKELKKYTKSMVSLSMHCEPTFRDTIAKLMSLFAKTKSRTTRRLQYLQLEKEDNEEMISYSLRVDKAFCAAEMDGITPEELNCLMFVAGLKSPKEAELRKWLIAQIDNGWPGVNLSELQLLCNQFEENNSKKPPIKFIPKTETHQSKVWRTVHLDFFHIEQDHFVVLFDAYSHWPEVYVMPNSKAASIVDAMQASFSRFGLPKTLVLSCDPSLTQVNSKLFLAYCDDNGISYTLPNKNYFISHEAYLQFKDELKDVIESRLCTESCQDVIRSLLVDHKNLSFYGAPDSKTPAELMLGRSMRVNDDPPPEYSVARVGVITSAFPF